VLTTFLGVLLGVLRLSPNPLLARLLAGYIEIVRNIPLLLQLFFWYVIITQLPGPRQAINPVPGFFLSNRGMQVPGLEYDPMHAIVWATFLIGLGLTLWLHRRNKHRQEVTGELR